MGGIGQAVGWEALVEVSVRSFRGHWALGYGRVCRPFVHEYLRICPNISELEENQGFRIFPNVSEYFRRELFLKVRIIGKPWIWWA